jgi:hypothetical protein
MKIGFKDSNGSIVLEQNVLRLSLKEESIIAKSMEFYNDPEPCMLHRSAVMKRMYLEWEDFILRRLPDRRGLLKWEAVPQKLRDYLEIGHAIDELIIG